MTGILLSVTVDEAAIRRLEALPAVAVRVVKPDGRDWVVSDDLARGAEVLLCKYPPRNLADLADLKVLQLSTVGYEHLRHLGLADRPLRVCNARGVFDTAIAEWNLAMMVNLARDLRAMARNQQQGRWDRGPRFQQEVRGRCRHSPTGRRPGRGYPAGTGGPCPSAPAPGCGPCRAGRGPG